MAMLIAGGCGFVGLALAESLLGDGQTVVLFDINPVPAAAARRFDQLSGQWTAVKGDVRDRGALAAAMTEHAVSGAFYGAALTSGAAREHANPEQVIEVNVLGFINLIKAAEACQVKRIINISSGAVYGSRGIDGDSALSEADGVVDPSAIYGATKFASERIGRRLAELTGIDIFSVRLSGIYGAWEIDSGARDTLSPLMQVALLARAGGVAIFDRRDRKDWTYSRHVGDALRALMAHQDRRHDLFHISSRREFSVLDFCAHLQTLYPNFSYRLAQPGEAATVNLHGDKDRPPLAVDRLADDIGYRLPTDSAADFADFTDWMQDFADFWAR